MPGPGPFVSVARVAIDEMIKKHLKVSKFGFFISPESITELVEELVGFVETSRNLKSAGDRLLTGQPTPTKSPRAQNLANRRTI